MDASPERPRLKNAVALFIVATALVLVACGDDYRIGEYVWVTWEGRDYPAYVIDQKGKTRYRVHYEGYDSRWDEDVTPDRIKGRIKGLAVAPPPPEKVARAMGLTPQPSGSAGAPSAFVIGDRIRVRWQGSIYAATITSLEGTGRIRVHYEGYGSEWDEVVSEDRVSGKR
jgi:RNA binding activity-knot of a chromodomain